MNTAELILDCLVGRVAESGLFVSHLGEGDTGGLGGFGHRRHDGIDFLLREFTENFLGLDGMIHQVAHFLHVQQVLISK